jgi:hypothetical protein
MGNRKKIRKNIMRGGMMEHSTGRFMDLGPPIPVTPANTGRGRGTAVSPGLLEFLGPHPTDDLSPESAGEGDAHPMEGAHPTDDFSGRGFQRPHAHSPGVGKGKSLGVSERPPSGAASVVDAAEITMAGPGDVAGPGTRPGGQMPAGWMTLAARVRKAAPGMAEISTGVGMAVEVKPAAKKRGHSPSPSPIAELGLPGDWNELVNLAKDNQSAICGKPQRGENPDYNRIREITQGYNARYNAQRFCDAVKIAREMDEKRELGPASRMSKKARAGPRRAGPRSAFAPKKSKRRSKPKRCRSKPKRRRSKPKRSRSKPKRSHSKPKRCRSKPKRRPSKPRRRHSKPRRY